MMEDNQVPESAGALTAIQRANLEAARTALRGLLSWKSVALALWPLMLIAATIWLYCVMEAIRLQMFDPEEFDIGLLYAQAFPAIVMTVFSVLIVINNSRTDSKRVEKYAAPCLEHLRKTSVVAALADGGGGLGYIHGFVSPFWRSFMGRRPRGVAGYAVLAARNLGWYLAKPQPVFHPSWIGQMILIATQLIVVLNIVLFALPDYVADPQVVGFAKALYRYTGELHYSHQVMALLLGSTIYSVDFRTTPIHATALIRQIDEVLAGQ
jgi:hypothetical protein